MNKNKRRGYAAVGLYKPKNSINVASALRACGCYGASMLAISGERYKRQGADTQLAYKSMPLIHVEDLKSSIPYGCVPVAVDIIDGAIPLPLYEHPERAFYIFGPEDGTLGKNVVSWCRDTIYVPTNFCMNLAAAVNVVLYDRLSKSMSNEIIKKNRKLAFS